MESDALNTLVTGAIWRAEQLEAHGLPSAPHAWAEVSSIEERLAKVFPVTEPEGRIARYGAVRAALKAADYGRAETLAQSYASEVGVPRSVKTELRQLLEEDSKATASRFRDVSERHSPREARELETDRSVLEAALVGYQTQLASIQLSMQKIRKQLGQETAGAGGAAAVRTRRRLSAAARKRIAAAQRKRWAEYNRKKAATSG